MNHDMRSVRASEATCFLQRLCSPAQDRDTPAFFRET